MLSAVKVLLLALDALTAWGWPQVSVAAAPRAAAPAIATPAAVSPAAPGPGLVNQHDRRGTYRLHGRAHVSAGAALTRDLEVRADAILAPGSGRDGLRIRLEQGGYGCDLVSQVGPGGRLALAPGQRCTLRLRPPDGPGQLEVELVSGEGQLSSEQLELQLTGKVSGSVSLRSLAGEVLGEAGLNLPAVPVRGEARAGVEGRRDRSRAARR